MGNTEILNRVDNTNIGDGIGAYRESTYYYHTYDSEHGHLLFTEHELDRAKDRVSRKNMVLDYIETEPDPWWKVW